MASLTSFIPLTSPQFGADDLQLAFLSSGRPLAEKMVALESDLMAQLSLTEEPIVQPKPRRDCERCDRPRSVCLCPWLPEQPVGTAGRLIILQHPHEQKKRLATVPLLEKCLAGVTVLRSRTYKPANPLHAPLRAALEAAAARRCPLLVLFPGVGSRDVHEVGAELRSGGGGGAAAEAASARAQDAQQEQQAQPEQQGEGHSEDPLYVLLIIDGTWKQAKEMFARLLPHVLPPGGPGVRVHLPPPATQQQQPGGEPTVAAGAPGGAALGAAEQEPAAGAAAGSGVAAGEGAAGAAAGGAGGDAAAGHDGPLLLRMEPMEGCLTTCEAVARTLGALEPAGAAVRAAVLRPLAQLTRFQAAFDPATAERLATPGSGYSQARAHMGLSRGSSLHRIT